MFSMESLSTVLSSAPPLQSSHKTPQSTTFASKSVNFDKTRYPKITNKQSLSHSLIKTFSKHQLSITILNLFTSSPSHATTEQLPDKINLESLLLSIDDFFNRNPFFVAGCTFIWLVVIPIVKQSLRKYKFVACIDAFRKLRDDPTAQLLDIRDDKSLAYLRSPNLASLKKSVVQVPFREGYEDEFVKKVLEKFANPSSTAVCVLDNFDGSAMKVAELLFKSGFKEAYAVKGGVRGKKGWQEIQENLLPPSVHVYPTKKAKESQPLETNGGVPQKNKENSITSPLNNVTAGMGQNINNGHVKSIEGIQQKSLGNGSSSPYPNYPDLKPPTSPAPTKPQR